MYDCLSEIIDTTPPTDVRVIHGGSFDQAGEGVPVLMNNVSCTSQERRLTDCRYEEQGSCGTTHIHVAGVICSKGK